jgi:hypothetical protein
MTTDAGRPPVAGGAVDDGRPIIDGDEDGEVDRAVGRELDPAVDRELEPVMDRPSEPSGLPLGLCPFLATESGDWRAAFPSHEHQCTAVEPPVPLALEKQSRLCLVAYHETCATYRAALAERAPLSVAAGLGTAAAGRGATRARGRAWAGRPVARTTPILLERPGPGLSLPPAAARSASQIVLVALVIIAFILIALARLGTPGSPAAAPASPAAAASPSPTELPRSSPTVRPSGQPSAPASSSAPISSNPPG